MTINLELAGLEIFTFASGFASSGAPTFWPGPQQGWVHLYLGIDLYPLVQPNNGSATVSSPQLALNQNPITIFQVQQSANFPGPFHWRGLFPLFANNQDASIDATVSFAYTVWGVQIPDYTLDG